MEYLLNYNHKYGSSPSRILSPIADSDLKIFLKKSYKESKSISEINLVLHDLAKRYYLMKDVIEKTDNSYSEKIIEKKLKI